LSCMRCNSARLQRAKALLGWVPTHEGIFFTETWPPLQLHL
jgi:hypothetical protein